MRFTALSIFLGLLAVQQAAAGAGDSDWQCNPGFPICAKSPNKCSNPQKGGISCAEESQPVSGSCTGVQGMGVSNGNYGTMKLNSKRSLSRRNGGSSAGSTDQKCVKQTCGSSPGSGITFNKGSGSQYSCNAHHIVVEQPTIVQITHYNHDNGQTCQYHQLCNANEVTTINNDNCGKSDYHEVCVHPNSPSGPNVPIGVVGMNFECTPGPSSTCSPPVPASSKPVQSKTSPSSPPLSTAPIVSPSVTPSSPSAIVSVTTTPVVSPSSTPSPSVTPSSPSPSESGTTSPVVAPSSTPSPSVTPSSPSLIQSGTTSPGFLNSTTPSPSVTPSSPSPVESGTTTVPVSTETTSLTTYTTLTSCPVTSTTVVSGSTSIIVKTSLITSTIVTCTRCHETPSSTPVVPPPQSSSAAPPPPPPSSAAPPPPPPSSAAPPPPPPSSAAPPPPPPSSAAPPPPPPSSSAPPPPAPTTTAPGSPQESGTTSSAPSPPPVVYTSTPVVLTTTTEIVLTTLTTCPVTKTITPPSQPPTVITTTTVSTVITTSTSTITTTTLSPPTSAPGSVVPGQLPSSSTPVVPLAQPSPPPAFQGCISAWYDLKGCGSNTDYDCYCQHDEVTIKVYECITSYEQDVAKQAAAMASYQGLCNKYVPQHLVIVTKSVELIPTPVSTLVGSSSVVVAPSVGPVTPAPSSPVEAGQTTTTTTPIAGSPAPTAAPSPNVPTSTIPISVTVSVPCSAVAGLVNQISDGQVQVATTGAMAPGCTTTSLFSTQLAVTPMHFATSGSSVGLAAGTPAANQAGTTATPAVPVPVPGVAGVATVPGGTTTSSPSGQSGPAPSTFKGAAAKTSHSGVFLSVVLAAVGLIVYA